MCDLTETVRDKQGIYVPRRTEMKNSQISGRSGRNIYLASKRFPYMYRRSDRQLGNCKHNGFYDLKPITDVTRSRLFKSGEILFGKSKEKTTIYVFRDRLCRVSAECPEGYNPTVCDENRLNVFRAEITSPNGENTRLKST